MEQDGATFYTLYDHDRYIIVEQARGLTRYFILKSTQNSSNDCGATFNTSNHIYNLIHYVIPSVPESARVQ